jgi:20S proteasome subunit beta 2
MELNYLDTLNRGGFDFDNCVRNNMLAQQGVISDKPPMKTGTTIVGLVFEVILSLFRVECVWLPTPELQADQLLGTRTARKCIIWLLIFDVAELVQRLTAIMLQVSFLQFSLEMIRRDLELHRLSTGRENRVTQASMKLSNHLFRYQGHIGTALIIGGVDCKGSHLISVSPHGNTMELPYMTTGSGSLAAMGIFETQYKEGLTVSLLMAGSRSH